MRVQSKLWNRVAEGQVWGVLRGDGAGRLLGSRCRLCNRLVLAVKCRYGSRNSVSVPRFWNVDGRGIFRDGQISTPCPWNPECHNRWFTGCRSSRWRDLLSLRGPWMKVAEFFPVQFRWNFCGIFMDFCKLKFLYICIFISVIMDGQVVIVY